MERGPKKRKREPYKTYLGPKSQFLLPRSTARSCLQSDTSTRVPLSSDDADSDTERADPPSRTASEKSWESDVDSPGERSESDEDFPESDNEPATSSVDQLGSSAGSTLTAPAAAPEAQEQRNSGHTSQDFPARLPDAPSDEEAPLQDSIASFSDADDPSLFDEDEEDVILDDHAPQQGFPGDSLRLDDDMQAAPDPLTEPDPYCKARFGDLFTDIVTEKVVLSKGDILLMALKHAVKNNLTLTGLTSLIDLINRIFDKPILPHPRYHLHKLLNKTGTTMTFFFFCPKCFSHIGSVQTNSYLKCLECNHTTFVSSLSDAPFFVTLDVESQHQRLLKDCDLLDLTKPLPPNRTFSDIWDGKMYRTFVAATQHCGPRISFSLNADGTPLFKSSGTSIWPIQLIVNELPPQQRMSKLVLAALWFWKEKPNMALFQGTFVEKMNELCEKGVELQRQGKVEQYKVYCICSSVDSVARAPMQGVTQFNGYFGCNWCLQKGERAGGATKYPVQEVEPPERTELQMLTDMEVALKGGVAVHGVKTVSPLISLPHFNIVWSFVPDYMHCVLLGVARQFLELWFNSDSECSISRQQHIVDHRLMSIKPPMDVRRMPRPTEERKWWKAKELENWLLCYSVPVLHGILDKAYLQHWACLVEALHIMLQHTISPAELAIAEELFLEFHVRAEVLFGKSFMTFNMHQLTHIVKSVRLWGPLWTHSAFPFEAGNGSLKGAVKAANGIAHQVCRVLQMDNMVVELQDLAVNPSVAEYCASFDGTSTQKSTLSCDGFRFFGRGSQHAPAGLQSSRHGTTLEFTKYRRMLTKGSIITDSMYASNKRTDSSVVILQDGCFSVIEGIYHGSDNKAYISTRKLSCTPVKYNLVTMCHVLKVNRKAANTSLIQCSEISQVVVFVDLESASYVCLPPSSVTL
ncbi:uncharacterized protein LOC119402235 [Rhipicephalus sanguineus]|uniref:uncharacterized protein LOC119402235 n=1 Tax=Rhipicephalus sanguineus TaxID=34632 RepID=UPI0018938ABE|nr:uncharacterized protein LOC119402235 [Rhipicephalus sanguineus]